MKKFKYHYLYKITRLDESLKFYIGIHSTNSLDDGYFGSGTRIIRSIKKYGKELHKKEILEFFETRKELIDREQEIVNEHLLQDEKCINIRKGGANISEYQRQKPYTMSEEHRKIMSIANKGRKISEHQKRLLSKTCSETVARLKETGEWDEVKRKNALAHTGIVQSPETIQKRMDAVFKTKLEKYGGHYTFSEQGRKNIAQSQLGNEKHAKDWIFSRDDGTAIEIRNLHKWLRQNNFVVMKDGTRVKDYQTKQIIGNIAKKVKGTSA